MIKRVIFGFLNIVLFFFLPWWVVFILAAALTFYFENYFEIIIIALLADIVYGSLHFLGYPYLLTIIAVILFFIIKKFKNNLIAY